MVTLEEIEALLMEDSERGMRAVGRALVWLYSQKHGGIHKNPLGVAAARYFLIHHNLTEGHLKWWRRVLKENNKPHILKHSKELLEIAYKREERRKLKKDVWQLPDTPEAQVLRNQIDDVVALLHDARRSQDKYLTLMYLRDLRTLEQHHNLNPVEIKGLDTDEVLNVSFELDAKDNQTVEQQAKEYLKASKGS